MKHHLNLHLDGQMRLSVSGHGGSHWLYLTDGTDKIAIFSDATPEALARAADAFNAALADAARADEQQIAAE